MDHRRLTNQAGLEAKVSQLHSVLGALAASAQTAAMPIALTSATNEGNLTLFANSRLLRLLAHSNVEVIGMGFSELMSRRTDPSNCGIIHSALSARHRVCTDIEFLGPDGQVSSASLFVSPLRDHNGAMVYKFVSFLDVTNRYEELSKAKAFSSAVSSTIRDTLAGVRSLISYNTPHSRTVAMERRNHRAMLRMSFA